MGKPLSEIARQAWLDTPIDEDHSEATVKAVRSQVIDECIKVVANGVKWLPEDAFSKTHITASNETAYLLAKALTALKDKADESN